MLSVPGDRPGATLPLLVKLAGGGKFKSATPVKTPPARLSSETVKFIPPVVASITPEFWDSAPITIPDSEVFFIKP